MSDIEARVITRAATKSFMDGPEHCREYVRNSTMWLGTSTIPPGQTGGIDPGHPNSIEIFYLAVGQVLFHDQTRYYELQAGDAIEIPKGLPHIITNIGEVPAVLVWAGAPGE